MANRTFFNRLYSGEGDVVNLFARCSIGAAGAVSGIEGTGINTITKESATGVYSIKLDDAYNKFLHGSVQILCEQDNAAKTCVTGTSEVNTFTFVAKSSCTAGDFATFLDTAGVTWAFSIDITGSDPEPSSALWTAIPAAKKVHVSIAGVSTADDVCLTVRNAVAALSGIGTTITVGSASTDHFAITHVYRAVRATALVKKADGTASPTSMTVAKTTTGIQTAVDPTNTTGESLTIPSHGWTTGKYVALAIGGGSLPSGWSATNYYVIAKDANTIQFATSLANAEAGTKVTISDYGTEAQTITVTPNTSGSGVAHVEFTDASNIDTLVQTAETKFYFTCYDYAQTPVQIANGSVMKIHLMLRNSNLKAKGES